jgi:hypothetical protein
MFRILDGFVDDAQNLVIGGMIVMAGVFTGTTWARTKALAPTLGALLLGAVVVYGVRNFDDLASIVEKDVDTKNKTVQVGS